MFIAREKELDELREQIESNEKTAVLIYGRRRVGKSTLIAKAAEKFKGVVIDHMCVESTFDGNMSMLSRSVCSSLSLPDIRFSSLKDVFDFLEKHRKNPFVIAGLLLIFWYSVYFMASSGENPFLYFQF